METNTKIEVIAEDKRDGLQCVFEYYDKQSNSMVECGSPAMFRVGKSNKKCLCQNCAVNARLIMGCKIESLSGNYFDCVEDALND